MHIAAAPSKTKNRLKRDENADASQGIRACLTKPRDITATLPHDFQIDFSAFSKTLWSGQVLKTLLLDRFSGVFCLHASQHAALSIFDPTLPDQILFTHQDHSQFLSILCFSGSTQTCMLIMQFKPHQASCIPFSAVSYGLDLLRASWQWW